jgi:hypothetical protein
MSDQPERTFANWTSSPEGRVKNISLAPNPKNALFPLFEAVMNSIHAIEERFGRDGIGSGTIEIEVMHAEGGDCLGFRVRDNGIGFTQRNLESFVRMDSQTKADIGGKGVGRLLWLKVAKEVSVESHYKNGDVVSKVDFTFCIEDPIRGFRSAKSPTGRIGTTVELLPYNDSYARCIPKKLSTISNRVLAHFISYFVNINHPQIVIYSGDETIDLFDQFASSVERDQDFKFTIELTDGESDFVAHCFLLPKTISDDEKSTNALYLGANGRAVSRFDMDAVLGMKAIDGKFAFLGYIESQILNATANETRTDFSLAEDDIDLIVDTAKAIAREFLAPEIEEIREKQTQVVAALRIEHPRFLSIARDPKAFAATLHLSNQKPEEIYVELSRQSLRTYKRRKSAFQKSVKKNLPDIAENAKKFVSGLQEESISSLAEYVTKRKMIIDVFEESMKYTDNATETSEYENVLHEIICPLKTTTDDLDYEDHNLWIVDDRLAFFSYFNSDKNLSQQVANPDRPRDRPDISIFDLGLGFQNTDASQPITIIEFKRPKHDSYTIEKNPITQVRKYVEDLRSSGEAIKYDGTPLRVIDANTPIMCHIIADVTPTLLKAMKDLGPFHQKAGTRSYYRWDDAYRVFIEISSFSEILASAKARNQAFFEKLGLV